MKDRARMLNEYFEYSILFKNTSDTFVLDKFLSKSLDEIINWIWKIYIQKFIEYIHYKQKSIEYRLDWIRIDLQKKICKRFQFSFNIHLSNALQIGYSLLASSTFFKSMHHFF